MFVQLKICCSIWRFRGFWYDRNERKHILHRNRLRVSNFLSHRMVGSLKFMIFDILEKSLHHQMILGPPDGSLDFSKLQRLLVERPSAKIHFENDPPKKNPGNWKTSKSCHCLRKRLPFLCFFWGGPHLGIHSKCCRSKSLPWGFESMC